MNWNDVSIFRGLQESAISNLTRDFEDSLPSIDFEHIHERFNQVRQSAENDIKQIFSEYVAQAVVSNIISDFNKEVQDISDPAERAEEHARVVEILTAMGFRDRIVYLNY